ncbi:RBBP9/YdeN family alpha/beta hydrolase [Acinetobacter equi]|uniref:Esterase n=1 Tax=Acinetobacter equi TaxID=1324350 RepID=A0A0N9VSQ3_9GAMM|nr:alpha/beta hydrolase [Acinetobacter equi]ALH96510.1 esterase [Acinetobacter equi]
MTHTVIVPGVGGSEANHWQSWLQQQLMCCSRVQQKNWNLPILQIWVNECIKTLEAIQSHDIQIVAHSFGCLTTVAALAQHSELNLKVKNIVLVAPANPARFSESGFATSQSNNYLTYFQQLKIQVPATLIISENDPWLSFEDANELTKAWHLSPVNLGQVGHINVASGFGPFPEILNYLISEKTMQHINISDDSKYLFKFAF